MRLSGIQKKLKAPKGQTNTFGGYNYRSCSDILEAVKPLLDDATITITDELVMVGQRYYVKATCTFKSTEEEVSTTAYAREAESKKGMDLAQVTGAASTYARKYALCGLLAIDDSSDDPDRTNDHGKGMKARETPNTVHSRKTGTTTPEVLQSGQEQAPQPATAESINKLTDAMQKYADMCGRSVTDVSDALVSSKTMKRVGYDGNDVTEDQARIATMLVESWIDKSKEK